VVWWDDATWAKTTPRTVLLFGGAVCWLLPVVKPRRLVGSVLVAVRLGMLTVARLRNGTAS
jgi:hypothetical protein